jgi:amino-acid N-acetyltransferase
MSPSSQSPTRVCRGADMPAVLALLQASELPTADLTSLSELRAWVIESNGALCGVIALERFGTEGLLRSLAVQIEYRNRGFGRTLVARLEHDASEAGVKRLVLLTQTAQPFFHSLGYQTIDRRHVSEEMKQGAEFRSLCPASATCMVKTLAARVEA